MLRKFRVNVNGKEYLVEMEELGTTTGQPAPAPAQQAPASVAPAQPAPAPVAPAPAPVAPAQPAPAPATSGNQVTLDAPMPGTILKVMVNVGDQVAFEQPLVILEAMKMENELVAPRAGVVTAIHVAPNSAIDVGKPIITIE